MPEKILNRTQKTRKQNLSDLEEVFGYNHGRLSSEGDPMLDEVEETLEIFDQYSGSRELWAEKFQEAVEFRGGAQWTNEEKEVLEARGQAPIVINRIHPAVESAKAMLTANRPSFRAAPREDSDNKVAQIT